ncbi:hypothetical protein DFS33DRAFT_1275636 [Desarmillaria ectypa]|nr:hypothetical protein DFS33DRAFT_1275636 [Desarmillaria ectypa]
MTYGILFNSIPTRNYSACYECRQSCIEKSCIYGTELRQHSYCGGADQLESSALKLPREGRAEAPTRIWQTRFHATPKKWEYVQALKTWINIKSQLNYMYEFGFVRLRHVKATEPQLEPGGKYTLLAWVLGHRNNPKQSHEVVIPVEQPQEYQKQAATRIKTPYVGKPSQKLSWLQTPDVKSQRHDASSTSLKMRGSEEGYGESRRHGRSNTNPAAGDPNNVCKSIEINHE